jgi:hypothetical protein
VRRSVIGSADIIALRCPLRGRILRLGFRTVPGVGRLRAPS